MRPAHAPSACAHARACLLLLFLLLLCCISTHTGAAGSRLAVFHRLYEQAIALRSKLDQKRDAVKQEEIESIQVGGDCMFAVVLQLSCSATCATPVVGGAWSKGVSSRGVSHSFRCRFTNSC